MRIVLLGAPGCGKSTQADLLAVHYGIPRVSTGDALRAAARLHTALGLEAKAAMDAGELVDDRIVVGIIAERLARDDAAGGFILDGFPRTLRQAQKLDAMLAGGGEAAIDAVLRFAVPGRELLRRLAARCDDSCDEAAIRHRLEVYRHSVVPLLWYYREQNKLLLRDGTGTVIEVFGRAVQALDGAVSGLPL